MEEWLPLLLGPEETRPVWLVVQTKALQERVAETGLAERGLEAYCPRILRPPDHPRAPRSPVPLFPFYLFCHVAPGVDLDLIRFCPGVRRPVRFGECLAALDETEIEFLRGREAGRGYLFIPEEAPTGDLSPGGRVLVSSGPFRGLEAVLDGYVASRDRVRILLAVASGTWRVTVPSAAVAAAARG